MNGDDNYKEIWHSENALIFAKYAGFRKTPVSMQVKFSMIPCHSSKQIAYFLGT